ncbi:tryptophanyl-trna synthetase [Stylonychia lemnae]|uniref:tryptophan--tRNA ligase n=1 Tax=Stylonychia lemnae TaxID=5949 RepID=A0A077ZSL3_STYLE|nr:tryptophanyl-trna synthetase [Stylonychia lemnae]|eukprot:CDW71471.1 tryptophanyl-trna synthetase [Stylonychia lemnae]
MRKIAQNVVLSGIQPSGFIHLGNYLGAVQNWVQLQNQTEIQKRYYSVVDYHSLTQKYVGLKDDGGEAEEQEQKADSPQELTLKTAATLLACGIDPKKSTLFVQSHVQAHTEMMWFLSCLTPQSWLNKMIQYKEKKGSKSDKQTSLSLYSYPVLMAADILAYRANFVPVGEDQTQHLELAKDIAERFNKLFAEDQLFPVPDKLSYKESPWVYNRVMSLVDASKKMSKSDPQKRSCINLIDDPEIIRIKISRAKTDSLGRIKYDPARPELFNLLHIYAAIEGKDVKQIDKLFEDDNMFSFKEKLSNKLIDKICPIGEQALNLCAKQEDYLLDVLDQGAKEANKEAEFTLKMMKEKVGILRRNI